jgi:hypothetical protein
MFSKRKYLIAMQCISVDKTDHNAWHWFFPGFALRLPILVAVDHCVLVCVKMQPCTGVNKHLAC